VSKLSGLSARTDVTAAGKTLFSVFKDESRPTESISSAGTNPSAHVLDVAQEQKITAVLVKAGITNPAAWAAAGLTSAVTVTPATGTVGGAAATAPARDQFDLHPSTVLMRGEHNPAFFISWRSQRDVVNSLSWKSTLMIWGGPALTLLSVYFMAVRFDWL
jgi:hypothetical protein